MERQLNKLGRISKYYWLQYRGYHAVLRLFETGLNKLAGLSLVLSRACRALQHKAEAFGHLNTQNSQSSLNAYEDAELGFYTSYVLNVRNQDCLIGPTMYL